MFHISGGSRLGLWITGADGDTIEYGLEPACDELQVSRLVKNDFETLYMQARLETSLLKG